MAAGTDRVWQHLGETDPYWAVMTAPQFHKDQLTDAAVADFFASGERHVEFVLDMIRSHFDETFTPWSCLDFGCGVGRLAIPFAHKCHAVVGVDISEAMLMEARKNAARFDALNTEFVLSDDELKQVAGKFDLIHSFIVLQHLVPARGERLIRRLLQHLVDKGFGVLHLVYSTQVTRGDARLPPWMASIKRMRRGLVQGAKNLLAAMGWGRPEMAMNAYHLNTIFALLQEAGVRRSFVQFTDHGGEYGVLVFFQKQAGEAYIV